MKTVNRQASRFVERINRRALSNNTQRVLHSLLTPQANDGWVARTAIPVPSATARIRELRRPEFGGFKVECITAEQLKSRNPSRRVRSSVTDNQTFYRVVPSSVTVTALRQVFKGVIS
jgi:hypothetical protein